MLSQITHMLVVNLHETDYLQDVLDILADEYVRDCVVYNAEGIASRHGKEIPDYGFFRGGLTGLLDNPNNQNLVIQAVLDKTHLDGIKEKLKSIIVDDRWASSFWFVPIEGYFYHKGDDNLE